MRSSSPPTGAHLTKTGRVSKATKGMPVHHCECGKTYTRAEHLRRHQQNHKPGAFPCSVRDCNKAFAREDLLIRHQAKHNENVESSETWATSTQGVPPLYDAFSSSLQPVPPTMQGTWSSATSRSQSSPSYGASTRKVSMSTTEQQYPNSTVSSGDAHSKTQQLFDRNIGLLPSHNIETEFQATVPAVPSLGHTSPIIDTGQLWTTETWDFDASHSPTLIGSVTPVPSHRGPSPACIQLQTPASEQWICDTGDHNNLSRNTSFGDVTETGLTMLPECRDILEQEELMTPTSVPKDFGARQYYLRMDNEQRYLDAYWRLVHPVWPIVHKPTFEMAYASPLLRASMLTLGACSIGNQIDSANACIMHKRCLKVVKKRTINSWHSHRICDLQAILLVELFSTYSSRRPALQLSMPFQENYSALSRNHNIDTTSPLFSNYQLSPLPQGLPTVTYESESEQRLLAAYYILDQEQAALFGRRNTDVPDFVPGNLRLPQPAHIWDAGLAYANSTYPTASGYYELRETLSQAATTLGPGAPAVEPHDLFTRLLILTYSTDSRSDASLAINIPVPGHGHHASSSNQPHLDLVHQTLDLCKIIPVRELLATAGESWVMAEKISLHADYTAAQETVGQWVSTSATEAFHRAVEIIRLHRTHEKTPSFYHDWSLHLATLVIWAYAYTRLSPRKSLRLSIPSTTSVEPSVQGPEVDGAVTKLISVRADDKVMWDDVKCVISWAKARMEKSGIGKYCGLVSGALDVLNALLVRGDEDGWF